MTAKKTPTRKKAAARKKTTARKRQPRSPRAERRRQTPEDEPDRGGRPAIDWNEEVAKDVHRLSRAGNTVEDMAAILEVSKASLESAISREDLPVRAAYYGGKAERRDALRTAQLRVALKGNPTMLIWLGKQELGQRDVKAVEVSGGDGGAVKVEGDLGPIVRDRLEAFLKSRGKKRAPR